MKAPPADPTRRCSTSVPVRGLWRGAGLLLLLLAVYAAARAWLPVDEQRDDVARALTFVVLVLSNPGLIYANRSWGRTVWLGHAESNGQFG